MDKTQIIDLQDIENQDRSYWRREYGIKTLEDCECCAEEVAAGFVPDGEVNDEDLLQLSLFEGDTFSKPSKRKKLYD